MEKFAITLIGKKNAVHVIEKLYTKLNNPKLNYLLLKNTNFSLYDKYSEKTPENIPQMMNEPSDENAALSSNDTQISYKRDNGFNAMLSLSKV